MKKTIAAILALVLAFTMLTGCGSAGVPSGPADDETAEDPVTIRVAGLKGPTSFGMIKLMEDCANGSASVDCDFMIAGSADEITPKLIQGELDIAAVPANLASVLYNKTEGEILTLAVNTLGVLYIVETGRTIRSIRDLKGRTVYATGKGSTPEYNLRYILQQNGIDPDTDVDLQFKSEPTEVVSLLAQQEGAVAMLPQPYVTVARGAVEGLHSALDLTNEWNKLDVDSRLITGVLAVRRDFAEAHPKAVAVFMEEYGASVDFVNADPAAAAQLIEKFGIVKAAVAQKSIPACHIVCISGAEMKAPLEGYLTVLHEQNPASVGGALPGDDFYIGE